MEITEVKVKLMSDKTDRLLAFCSVTLDDEFVIRDLKIIEGTRGRFVAMPSRKLADKCLKCGAKNHLRAAYCNECGAHLNPNRAGQDDRGRAKLHADIAHPINQSCRERMQAAILEAYELELERAKQPGYVAPDLDDYEFDKVSTFFDDEEGEAPALAPSPPPARQADFDAGVRPTPAEPAPSDFAEGLIASPAPPSAPKPAPAAPPPPPSKPEPPREEGEREEKKEEAADDFAAGIF